MLFTFQPYGAASLHSNNALIDLPASRLYTGCIPLFILRPSPCQGYYRIDLVPNDPSLPLHLCITLWPIPRTMLFQLALCNIYAVSLFGCEFHDAEPCFIFWSLALGKTFIVLADLNSNRHNGKTFPTHFCVAHIREQKNSLLEFSRELSSFILIQKLVLLARHQYQCGIYDGAYILWRKPTAIMLWMICS